MRDIAITLAVLFGLFKGLKHPWIAMIVWVVISVLNPHRFAYGFAYSAPFAMMSAAVVFIGLFITKDEKRSPFDTIGVLLTILTLWMCVTTAAAFFPEPSLTALERVLKINLMAVVAISLFTTEKQIKVLVWALTLSLAVLSAKGGLFTIASGGSYRVWGPPSSFVEDNNAFALASIMVVPLLFFLANDVSNKYLKWGLRLAAILSIFSALGSHSRGALLAMVAMGAFLWIKGKNKLAFGALILVLVPVAIAFLPDNWFDRMETLKTYEQDGSAMGRINAWHMAFNLANDRITGGGYAVANAYVFGLYAPDPSWPLTAHSIYFQMMGEHGWIGLFLYMAFWIYVWRTCTSIYKQAGSQDGREWMVTLARMIQVSLLAFAVGGAFLSLSYFDFPYYLAVIVSAMRRLLLAPTKPGGASGTIGASA